MRPLAIGLLLAAASVPGLGQVFPCATNCGAQIPDASGDTWGGAATPGVLVSTLDVPAGTCGDIAFDAVEVDVDVLHDWLGDLRIRVISPNTTAATLLDRPGINTAPFFQGGSLEDDVRATFSAAAATLPVPLGGIPAIQGTVNGPLGPLAGQLAAGTWSLEITDYSNTGNGALEDWSIEVICIVPPEVTIAATQPAAAEDPTVAGTFTVSRSLVSAAALTVNLSFGGTAGAGDYAPLPSAVVIPGGATSASFDVVPVSDLLVEGTETVTATVEPGVDYTVALPDQATVQIFDGVVPPPVPVTVEAPALSTPGLVVLSLLLGVLGLWRMRATRG